MVYNVLYNLAPNYLQDHILQIFSFHYKEKGKGKDEATLISDS